MRVVPRRSLPLLSAAALWRPVGAAAQSGTGFPERPIALVVPFLAGGSTDIAARILAERMAPHLGPAARIIVENRAGAGAAWVPSGCATGRRTVTPSCSARLRRWRPTRRRCPLRPPTTRWRTSPPVALVGGGPMVLVVPAASRFRTAAELFAAVRAEPGRHTWATSGAGGIGHLTGEYLKIGAGGLVAEHVPYRGGSAVMEALAKGEVDYSLEVLASTASHLRDGLSRGLAVSSLARHPLFPNIPTLDELGLRGFEITTWNILAGPRGLPADTLGVLSRAARAALAEPGVRERLAAAGVDPAEATTTPDGTRAFLQSELAKFRGIVERAGLRMGR